MELANLWPRERGNHNSVRVAVQADAGAIMRLIKTAVYNHLHVDWYLPGDWLGSPGFVVLPKAEKPQASNNLAAKLFRNDRDRHITACFAATADPLPVAWVRVATLSQTDDVEQILARMLAYVVPTLRQQGITQLAWLTVDKWPQKWLPSLGFYLGSHIESYVKEDRILPARKEVPGLTFRQAYSTDMEALAALETAAFAPMWRYSERALTIARPQSFSFDVALLHGEIVAFQLSAAAKSGVHLVRITVAPEKQGLGIGSALLGHAFAGYHHRGLYKVSLNTQISNVSSIKLYLKFGFQTSQQRIPIWMLDIT
ncbi:MAG: GNAT family N-acetyltransferase [Chloroflexi bacterium]|nr:GNAT family N-acetyltransferase [Chloroflexota bacterium]